MGGPHRETRGRRRLRYRLAQFMILILILVPFLSFQGMSVLRKINPTVQRAVADASLPLKLIASRTKPWFGGDTKEYDTLLTIPIERTFREAGGRITKELVVDNEVMAYTIMRGALQVRPRPGFSRLLPYMFRWHNARSHCQPTCVDQISGSTNGYTSRPGFETYQI